MRPFQLVCVRHGESAWNKDNKFCGWVDVPLSSNGEKEAHEASRGIFFNNLSNTYKNFQNICSGKIENTKKIRIFVSIKKTKHNPRSGLG